MLFEEVTEKFDKVIIVGGGESARELNMEQLLDFDGAIIAVNHAIEYMPRADFWITVDPMDGNQPQSPMLNMREDCKYYCAFPDLSKTPQDKPYYKTVSGVHYLERVVPQDGKYKLQEDKDKITTGDSCFGALGLAYHFEPKCILLLGIDLYGDGHWYDADSPYNLHKIPEDDFEAYKKRLIEYYRTAKKQLDKKKINVINGSTKSLVTCFHRMSPMLAYDYIYNI